MSTKADESGGSPLPLLLAGVDMPSSLQRITLGTLVAAVVLAIGATVAVSQPSLVRAVAVFGLIQAPHFGLLLFEGFRDPKYLFAAPNVVGVPARRERLGVGRGLRCFHRVP
jgi:hypothetical protein